MTPLTFAPFPPFLVKIPSPPDAPQASTLYFPVIGTCHSWTPFRTCTSWSKVPLYPAALTGPFFPVVLSVVKLYHPSNEPKLSKLVLHVLFENTRILKFKSRFYNSFFRCRQSLFWSQARTLKHWNTKLMKIHQSQFTLFEPFEVTLCFLIGRVMLLNFTIRVFLKSEVRWFRMMRWKNSHL